jgi:hypothetical protein
MATTPMLLPSIDTVKLQIDAAFTPVPRWQTKPVIFFAVTPSRRSKPAP